MKRILFRIRSKIFYGFWLLSFQSFFPLYLAAQHQNGNTPLIFEDVGNSIENTIEFAISKRAFKTIKKVKTQKIYFEDLEVTVNDKVYFAKEIHTRGQTSHDFRRKSFAIGFDKKVGFLKNGNQVRIKHVNALNLVWDKYYIRNHLAFGLMEKVGLSELFDSYANIKINGKNEGIYLLMERPQDWAFKKHNSPFIIRRGYDHRVDKLKTAHHLDSNIRQKYMEKYEHIYTIIEDYNAKELYQQLSKLIDVEMYMNWLAFNYLVSNGDYTDELYLYIDPKEERFKLIPWDYDDIFSSEPHEGNEDQNPILENKFIFSSEDPLDVKIAEDEYLYTIYIDQLKRLLTLLSPEIIKRELETIYEELHPYYSDQEIISISKYDWYKNANTEKLQKELNHIYTSLISLRSEILGKISVQPKIKRDEK